jgi:putative thiamine transport system permease protein
MILAWWLGERGVAWLARPWLAGGRRGPGSRRPGGRISRVLAAVPVAGIMALTVLAIAVLAIWSFARSWFYPAALPTAWTLDTWIERAGQLAFPAWITVSVAVTAAVAAVLLALANLENERHHDVSMSRRALWLLYLPLLLPQIGFLFGLQTLLVLLDIDGTWLALTAAHLIFVFPYVMIMLADPYRALDPRYGRTARCLGRPPWQTWLRITIPLLLRAISFAFAIGFAVSAAQYLPTIFAGAGRLVTLTTEAVTLASGQDRRIIGAYAIAQSALPWLVLVLALLIPTWLYRHRAGMRESSA